MTRFRPGLASTIAVVPMLAILASLGTWQLTKSPKAKAEAAGFEERLAAIPIRTGIELEAETESLLWRRVQIHGHYEDQPPFLVGGRYEFDEPGYGVVQVFHPDEGPLLLVDRGWIPAEGHQDALAAVVADGTASAELVGLVADLDGTAMGRTGCGASVERIDDKPIPAQGALPQRWPKGAYASMRAQLPVDTAPFLVVAGEARTRAIPPSRELPVGGYVAQFHRIPHLEYALQWYGIGIVLIIVWMALGFRRGKA